MIKSVLCLLALGVTLAVPAVADTTPFTLSGTLQDGGTLSGFLDVTASGYVNARAVDVRDGGYDYKFQGSFFEGLVYSNGQPAGFESVAYDNAGDGLTFVFPVPSLAGYEGGALCSLTAPCAPVHFTSSSIFLESGGGSGGTVDFTTLVASQTPEPGTLALVGTGVAGMLGAWRRRRDRDRRFSSSPKADQTYQNTSTS